MSSALRYGKMGRSFIDRRSFAASGRMTFPMRFLRSSAARLVVARLCFAFLLVFAQQQAFAHALEHDFERIHRQAGAPADDDALCAKCLAVAHLGHAGGVPGAFALDAEAATPPRVAHVPHAAVVRRFEVRYRSRAPPVLS